jgi:hypothetical protein
MVNHPLLSIDRAKTGSALTIAINQGPAAAQALRQRFLSNITISNQLAQGL